MKSLIWSGLGALVCVASVGVGVAIYFSFVSA